MLLTTFCFIDCFSLDFLFDLQWGHTAVRAVEAWNAGVTGAGVRVCVLDTGVAMSHPDLVDNINQELSIDFTGDSTDGRPDYLASDIYSHGSHVAGTIAASDSKLPLVLAPGSSIVSHPLSTHHVNTFYLGCYTCFRWLWNDWSSSRRGACHVSIPEETTNSACARSPTTTDHVLHPCFFFYAPQNQDSQRIEWRVRHLCLGYRSAQLRRRHVREVMAVFKQIPPFSPLYITSTGQPLTTRCRIVFVFPSHFRFLR
jgi:hypothetical protein